MYPNLLSLLVDDSQPTYLTNLKKKPLVLSEIESFQAFQQGNAVLVTASREHFLSPFSQQRSIWLLSPPCVNLMGVGYNSYKVGTEVVD